MKRNQNVNVLHEWVNREMNKLPKDKKTQNFNVTPYNKEEIQEAHGVLKTKYSLEIENNGNSLSVTIK